MVYRSRGEAFEQFVSYRAYENPSYVSVGNPADHFATFDSRRDSPFDGPSMERGPKPPVAAAPDSAPKSLPRARALILSQVGAGA